MSKPYLIMRIEHQGHAFIDNEHARLLCTGLHHHWIVLLL